METKDINFKTPGQLINSLMESKGWNQKVLAIVLGMEETGINRLVSDKRPVTAELALALQEVFGVQAERFLELQKSYDLAIAKISARPDPNRGIRAQLFGGLPVAEMIKRGWLKVGDIRNISEVETELSKYFGVKSPNDIEILPHAAKKTVVKGEVTPAQLAWLYRVRQVSNNILTGRYSTSSVNNAITKLNNLLYSPQEIRKVPRILIESGVRFVIVESLSPSKIDGVCLWADNTHPIIGMSLRHDRIDNFWFVLRHELEHVIQGHGQSAIMLDTEIEENITNKVINIPEEERIANQAATEFCVPVKSMNSFISRKAPLFTERDLLGFSKTINVHPGIVVGQLQHRTGRYELFRKYLVKVRSIVAPSAIVDGWGDIAPIGA